MRNKQLSHLFPKYFRVVRGGISKRIYSSKQALETSHATNKRLPLQEINTNETMLWMIIQKLTVLVI
jgi:hypothetical protein